MKEFVFDGNDRCLDFLNTEMYEGDKRIELLEDYCDVVDWLKSSGLVNAGEAREMLKGKKIDEQKVLKDIRGFRSYLKGMIKDMTVGKPPAKSAIVAINQILKTKKVYFRLNNHSGSIELDAVPLEQSCNPLTLLADCAVELLTQKDPALIKKCSDQLCTIYFYDESKNHTRRWCSMDRCGNRAKASAHYRKKKNR